MSNAPPFIQQKTWSTWPAAQAYVQWTDASGATNTLSFDLVESETWQEDATVTEHPVEVGANVGDHVRVALRTCELKVFVSNEPLGGSSQNGQTVQQTVVPLTPPPRGSRGPSPTNTLLVPGWDNLIALRTLAGQLVGLAGGASGRIGQIGDLALIEAADLLLPGVRTLSPVIINSTLVAATPPGVPTATVEMQPTPQDFVQLVHQQLLALKDSAQLLFVVGTKATCKPMVIEKLSLMRDVDTGTGESITIGFKELRQVSTQVVTAPIPNISAGGGQPTVNRGGQTPTPAPAPTQAQVVSDLYGFAHAHAGGS
jgi:hypothetical protein